MDLVSTTMDQLVCETLRLESEVKALEAAANKKRIQAANLRLQKNELLPVFRLPDEVLQGIFRDVRSARKPEDYAQIVSITLVCRRWRDVATNQPELWSHIVDVPRDFVPVLFERSKSTPVTVCLSNPLPKERRAYKAEQAMWQAVTRNFERVTSLDIQRPLHTLAHYVKGLVDARNAPTLHTLCLTNLSEKTFPTCDLHLYCFRAAKPKHMPKLRTIKLSNCRIDWDSPLLRNLTTFHIRYRNVHEHSTSSARFVDSLQKMDQLEELEIDIVIPSLTRLGNRKVCLHRLKSLKLTGRYIECHRFLDHIVIPENTVVRICCYEETENASVPHVSLIPRRWNGSPPSPSSQVGITRPVLRSLDIFSGWEMRKEGEPDAEFYAWPERIDFSLPVPNRNLCYEVPKHYGGIGTAPLLDALTPSTIISLSFRNWCSDLADIFGVMEDFTAVQDLFVTQPGTWILNVIGDHTTEVLENGGVDYLPELKNITFEEIFFESPSTCRHNRDEVEFEYLLAFVKGRKKLGTKIKTLQFVECWNLSVEQVRQLKTVVGKVVWPGMERWSECEEPSCESCKGRA